DKDDWTAYYPEEQAYAKVYLSETGKLTTTTTSGAVNVNYIDVTTGVSRVDTDFDTAVPDKPVILVGGPAVNKLVYNLAEEGKTQGVADYAENTALIQYIEDAFGTNDALIIAGHMAKDTQKAGKVVAGYVLNGQFSDLMQGNKVVFDTETMAKVE
ncbi:MAG: S-layer protein, partial [Nanoarchaeota archaeon]|nr:S-layer protein [Nanoarchaeota archaeon]